MGQIDRKSVESRRDDDQPGTILISLPSDGGYGYVVMIMGFVVHFILDGTLMNFGKILPYISTELEVAESSVALVGSIIATTHFISATFASALINSIGFRKSGFIGTIIATLFIFLASTSRSFGALVTFHALCGIGTGIVSASANICLGYHFCKYRSLVFGISTSGAGFGLFAISPIIEFFINEPMKTHGSWRKFLFWESILFSTLFFFSMLAAKPQTVRIKETNDEKPPDLIQKSPQLLEAKDEKIIKENSSEESAFSYKARISIWSINSRNSNFSRISIRNEERPTLAEIVEIQSPAPDTETTSRRSFRKKPKFAFQNPLNCCRKQQKTQQNVVKTLPLDHDDILYTFSTSSIAKKRASTLNMPESTADTALNHQLLLTRAPPTVYHDSRWQKFWFNIKRTLLLIFDVYLFKSWTFNVLCCGSLFYALGFYVPLMYLTDRAIEHQMPTSEAMWLLSVIGLGNIILRLAIGLVITLVPTIQASRFTALSLIISGSSTIVTAFFPQHPFRYQAIYCVCFALGNASLMTLRSVVYVETMGIEKLTSTFGVCSSMIGLGIVIGAPSLGAIKNFTGTYTVTFLMSGAFFIAAGISHYFLPIVRMWEAQKKKRDSVRWSI